MILKRKAGTTSSLVKIEYKLNLQISIFHLPLKITQMLNERRNQNWTKKENRVNKNANLVMAAGPTFLIGFLPPFS